MNFNKKGKNCFDEFLVRFMKSAKVDAKRLIVIGTLYAISLYFLSSLSESGELVPFDSNIFSSYVDYLRSLSLLSQSALVFSSLSMIAVGVFGTLFLANIALLFFHCIMFTMMPASYCNYIKMKKE
jgi:hypothetical protein